MVPQGGPTQRLNELLDQIRTEFEQEAQRSVDYEGQITRHIQEIEMIRGKIYALEQQHMQMKNKYEDDIARLRSELEARGGPSQSSQHHGPSQPQPPSIGHGPSNLFGGIMAGSAAGGGPGLAPPPQEPQQPQGLPPHMPQGPPGLNPAPGPQGPPQHFAGYQPGPPAPTNGKARFFGYQIAQPTASPGNNKRGGPRGPPGPATPQQPSAAPYPGSPQVPRPTPPPHQHQNPLMAATQVSLAQSNTLADLEIDSLPDNLKKEGQDWFAVFNPRARRVLDVELLHNLPHQSVVCCVRFSLDGQYIATGCNRSAQIFEVSTGAPVAHLQDGSLPEDGDLYIRSVCFSPNGAFLATGAEDKVIRVWDIASRHITAHFTGHEQDIYSLDFARNGRIIASGSGDRTVRLWDLETKTQVLHLTIEDGVTTVAISPDNRYVAAGSLDKSVRVWDVATGNLVVRLEGEHGHKDSVYSVAFAPSGDRLVSGSLDKTIKMWELTTPSRLMSGGPSASGKCIRTFEGHKDFVLSVALTPHGDWVLSGSKDRGVQFWDPHTGVAQLMLQGHKNSVISVAPSPTGGIFATGSGDMRARIWKFDRYNGP
ncbi:transcriptional repressor rco-1 [Amniculicola lignicola CBS 123094]|uniref:Transcriptional repressor rco-1 n=1 Tax=Amniculicola lignicola CBS 123094 TaxID=1392246 RepID=A0A6A5WSG6_9PLEO|nr:transcriptional repressor rco-1 [Amniculicola lignicola CBS 123094]